MNIQLNHIFLKFTRESSDNHNKGGSFLFEIKMDYTLANQSQKRILSTCNEIDILEHLSSRSYLSAVYKALKSSQKKFSYRAFAGLLGFGETNYLHLICKGQRALSQTAAEKIATAFQLSAKRKKYLLTLAKYESARKPIEKEKLFGQLVQIAKSTLRSDISQDQMKYFSQWFYPVLRELLEIPEFKNDKNWIANQLIPNIKPDELDKGMQLLEQIGYIVYNDKLKRYEATKEQIRTPKELNGIAITKYHQEMINQGREAIIAVDPDRRDISAITIRIDQEIAEEIKVRIQNFRSSLMNLVSEKQGRGDQVYQLNMQWFPFTKEKEDQ